jgi:hypothetical protein
VITRKIGNFSFSVEGILQLFTNFLLAQKALDIFEKRLWL